MRSLVMVLRPILRVRLVAAIAITVRVLPIGAQSVPERVEDTRLRIETRQGSLWTGRVVRVGGDSIFLREDRQHGIMAIAQRDVRRIAESTGVRRARGAKRGAMVGGVLGIALIVAAARLDASFVENDGAATDLAVPVAVGVTLIGTGLGAASAAEGWKATQELKMGAGIGMTETRSIALNVRIPF